MFNISVNNIFDELFNENKRLLNELLFADKCIKVLNEIKRFLDLNSNEIKVNLVSKQLKVFNDLLQTIEEVFREKNSFVIEVKEEVIEKNIRSNKRVKSSVKKNPKLIKMKGKNESEDKNNKEVMSLKKNENKRIETMPDNNFFIKLNHENVNNKQLKSSAKKHSVIKKDKKTMKNMISSPKNNNYNNSEKSIESQDSKTDEWVCDREECRQRFQSEKKLIYHLSRHKTIHKCDYPRCQFKYPHINKLIRHQRKHTGEKPFECDICHKKFKHEIYVNQHKQRFHYVLEEPVICGIDGCVKEFKSELSLNQHRKVYHSEPRFVCDHTGCQFKSRFRTLLVVHQKVHTNERPFTCPVCNQSYKTSCTLTTHMKLHDPNSRVRPTERNFRCTHDDCNKTFMLKRHLKMHFNNCHSDNWIHCDWPGCEYRSRKKESIVSHMASHSTELTVACIWPNCDKMFKTIGNMRQHLLIHKGDKRHACHWPGCQYRCLTGGNLKIHINNVHKKAIK